MFRPWCLIAALAISLTNTQAQAEDRLLVFAAASMKNVAQALAGEYEISCDCRIVHSFAGTGTLARQVKAGAPADLFISADKKWVSWLQSGGDFVKGSKRDIARNRLVLAVNNEFELPNQASPLDIVAGGRFSMGEPVSVPAGRYAKQALESLGVWEEMKAQAVFASNVRIALSMAARGDVRAALVYQSDLKVEPRVKLGYLFNEKSHEPIVYSAVLVRENAKARAYLEFLTSSAAKRVFSEFGFSF